MWGFFQRLWNGGKSTPIAPADIGFDGFSIFEFDVSAESEIQLNRVGHISGINIDPFNGFSTISIQEGFKSEMTIGCGVLSTINLFDSDVFSRFEFNLSAVSEIDTDGDAAVSGINVQGDNRFSIISIQEGFESEITTGCGAISTITINIGAKSEIQ